MLLVILLMLLILEGGREGRSEAALAEPLLPTSFIPPHGLCVYIYIYIYMYIHIYIYIQ